MAEDKILIGVILSTIISLFYCYYISSKIPKGKLRFISLIPVFYLFTTLPLYFSSAIGTTITFVFITWLANFKLLLFCFDRGPLSSSGQPKSLLIFIFLAALPCKIKDNKSNSYTKPKKIPLNLPIKILFLAFLVTIMHKNSQGNYFYIHPKIVMVFYIFMLYLWLDVFIASATTAVRVLVGLELEPPSDEPYLATSLQDLWGRRWNLMITNILRDTVFLNVRSASTDLMGKKTASLVAVIASFAVSGLMHELLLYYVSRAPSTWEMGSFFLLHGVCLVLEIIVKRAFTDRWRLPPLVSTPLTVGFALVTSVRLFCPPMINNGIHVKFVEEGVLVFEYTMTKLLSLQLQQWWN